jgi:hypothetical protein
MDITVRKIDNVLIVQWRVGEYRYHFWTKASDPTLTPERDLLYKAVVGKNRVTRLNANAAVNQRMIAQVKSEIYRLDLVAKARVAYVALLAEKAEQLREGRKQAIEQELAVEFFARFEADVRAGIRLGFTNFAPLIAELDAARAAKPKEAGL